MNSFPWPKKSTGRFKIPKKIQTKRSAYYDDQLRDLVVKNLAMQAAWQVNALGHFGIPVIIFIDEPALYTSGLSTHITLKKENLIEEINTVIQAIHDAGALAGVHSCSRADWEILLESKSDIISFDAFSYFDSLALYSSGVNKFLSRGGTLAWGLIPTSESVMELTAMDLVSLFRRQVDTLVAKGISYDALLNKALITPSCGTGNLSGPIAEKIYALTAEVSNYLVL
ncbi:MAG: uroporphyrinogen decarboxylase/cobalamine-independent methonine synthase family protein [Bacillota bacterium]